MKKFLRIALLFALIIVFGILLIACSNEEPIDDSVPASVDQIKSIYLSAVEAGYTGTYEQWLNSIKGDEIELRVAGGYVQTKYKNDVDWTNLLELSTLKGNDGVPIKPQIQVANGYIQWKEEDENEWHNLIAVSDLEGSDGREVEFRDYNTPDGNYYKLLWKYTTEDAWKVVFSIRKDVVNPSLYSIVFEAPDADVSYHEEIYVSEKTKLTKPADPTRTGYVFEGWYSGNDKWNFSGNVVVEDIILTARWTKVHTVTFDALDADAGYIEEVQVSEMSKLTKPMDPVKTGYTFLGWYSEKDKWNFNGDVVLEDTILLACWKPNGYGITMHQSGGDPGILVKVITSENIFYLDDESSYTFQYGTRVLLIIEGYSVDWNVIGQSSITVIDNTCEFVMPNGPVTVEYTIT